NNTQGEIQDLGGYRCYTAAYSRNYPEAHDAIGLVDSGAFSDSPEDRLTFEQALTRQLKWENTASTRLNNRFYEFPVVSHTTPFQPFARCRLLALFEWQAYALASYDLLIDEVWLDGAKIKRRWSEEDAKAAVTTTVEAARYLVSQRDHLQPRKLILGCQGVTADQYRECVEQILEFASPEDWIGLGGWCILGRMRSWLPTYWETLHQVIPLIAAAGIKHVHLYGSLLDESCAPLLWFCDQYGLTCSADSKRPIVDVTYPDRVRAGVRAATGYWRDNVQWWQNHFANMRQSKWYKEPPRQHQQLSILRPTVTTVTEPVLTQPEVAKPFLKWAGGKSWAIPLLQELYTSHRDRRYCDLTLGSGAIPLALQPDRAYLCDKNPFLIQLWEWVQTDGRLTIDLSTDKDYYLECRDRFNAGDLDQAQLFYYLNHTCWRGLYRSSKEKFFNVPWGDYKKFHGQTDLTHYKQVIEHWEFAVKSWEDAIQHIQSDDFVVFDPPYHSTDGAGFTQYFGAFTEADQIAAAEALSNLDVPIVAFNAATDFILDLYRGLNFTTQIKEAPRMISSTGDRAPASEMVATKNTEKKLISLTSYLKHRLDQPNDSALTTDSCQSDLSYDEQRDRIHLERKVEAAFYEAGKALKQLRDRRLYRSTHPTWEAYCQDRFGFSHQNGDKKIAAAKVVDVLTTNGCQLLPSSGEQAYPLSRLVDDEQKVEVWEELTQDGKRPSGKKVRNVVAEICDRHAERGDYHNPWQVGDICQIMKKGDGTLARYDGCWSIVSEVKTRQCVVKVWDKELLVKVENLEELVVGEEFLLVCDRVRSLMSRHMDGTITLKRGQLRFLEAMGEQVETFDPDDIEMLSCIEAKVNSCDASLVQAARLVADNVECLTSEEARSLFEALQATHGL
ncbi:Dam family site-specific DNA-(adenine-N6)-methyltransferase, partial [Allocoleopsis sp.]|uniref:DNA adenine methylase n=1 Tax=Allocoleopsis sp. TaxID=3088169 RepID=UPI002FD45B7B